MRRVILVLSVLVLVAAVLYYWPGSPQPVPKAGTGVAAPVAPGGSSGQQSAGTNQGSGITPPDSTPARLAPASADTAAAPPPNPATDFPIIAPLNAPGSTVQRDLDVVSQLFEAWQSNFPREGNPVGENA